MDESQMHVTEWKTPDSIIIFMTLWKGKIIGPKTDQRLPGAGDIEELTTKHEGIFRVLELFYIFIVLMITCNY